MTSALGGGTQKEYEERDVAQILYFDQCHMRTMKGGGSKYPKILRALFISGHQIWVVKVDGDAGRQQISQPQTGCLQV